MPRLDDLVKALEKKTQEELYEHIRGIRTDRKLTKVPVRVARAKRTAPLKLVVRFGNMTEEEQAAFLKSVEKLNEDKAGKGK